MAERLGFDREEALTLECALARLTAHAKGVLLVIFELFTPEGLWVPAKDLPTRPESVERYLSTASSAIAALGEARTAMEALAGLLPPVEPARLAFRLYEQFRRQSQAARPTWTRLERWISAGRLARPSSRQRHTSSDYTC